MASAKTEDIRSALPSNDQIVKEVNFALDYWRERNNLIEVTRRALEGSNPIRVPDGDLQYTPVAIHTYFLASVMNEKTSRFLDLPIPQVINDWQLDDEAQAETTELERALTIAQYEMERNGDGDVWSRVVSDAILIEEGVERIELAPAAFWSEIVELDGTGENVKYPFQSKEREALKMELGVPIRSVYVPLENTYPIYDGPTCVKNFEFEHRSLAMCKQNKLFDQTAFQSFQQDGDKSDYSIKVPIMHYVDQHFHAYFAVVPGGGSNYSQNPASFKIAPNAITVIGNIEFLYGYRHNLGRVIYNFVGGRHGGWKTQTNRIASVNKGFLELSQLGDEVLSQVATNVRATDWPSMVHEVDPDQRGYSPGSTPPKAPKVNEGESITIFAGEKLEPLMKASASPLTPWLFDQIKDQLNRLGGSTVLFGENQPGVDTGYHNAQQISQAEHLDEKIEQNLARGAINRFTIILLHVRQLGEKVWVHYRDSNKETRGRKGRYISIDPKMLTPLPRLDVAVRRPRSIDYIASLRAAREATDDRNGRGPLLSDSYVRNKILAVDFPDTEEKQIIIEEEKFKLRQAGIIQEKIAQAINLNLAKQGAPQISQEMLSQVDPALLEAIQASQTGNAANAGGINPATLGAAEQQAPQQQNPLDRSGGMMSTDGQPEARIGEAIAAAAGTP